MRKNIISITVATVVVALLISAFFVIENKQYNVIKNSNRLYALQRLVAVSDGIQNEFNQSLQCADFFDVIISKDPSITKGTIAEYAKLILKQNKNIDSVQLAPDGIVSMIYPLKGNKAAMGHNLLTDPKRKQYAQRAIEKRIPVSQGPVKAKQSGYLVFNRKAIFITENKNEKFWGFSIIALNFTDLLKQYENKMKSDNYFFALRVDKGDKEQKILWGDYQIFHRDAVVKKIVLPDNVWEVAIYPKSGWVKEGSGNQSLKIYFFVVAFMAYLLIYGFTNFYQQRIDEAKKDLLTETLNKKAIIDIIMSKLAQKKKKHGMILLDLNRFKQINDKLGHPVGDAVLMEVARRIKTSLRKEDRVSRFGGDEFLVFVSNIENDGVVKQITERIVECVAIPMYINGMRLEIGISAGYATSPNDGMFFENLYQVADEKMYENKRKNKIIAVKHEANS